MFEILVIFILGGQIEFMRNADTLTRVSILSGDKLNIKLYNLKSLTANSSEQHYLETKWLQKLHRKGHPTPHWKKSIFKITPLFMLIFEELLKVDIRDRRKTSKGKASPASFTHITCTRMTWSTHRSSTLKSIKNP